MLHFSYSYLWVTSIISIVPVDKRGAPSFQFYRMGIINYLTFYYFILWLEQWLKYTIILMKNEGLESVTTNYTTQCFLLELCKWNNLCNWYSRVLVRKSSPPVFYLFHFIKHKYPYSFTVILKRSIEMYSSFQEVWITNSVGLPVQ